MTSEEVVEAILERAADFLSWVVAPILIQHGRELAAEAIEANGTPNGPNEFNQWEHDISLARGSDDG